MRIAFATYFVIQMNGDHVIFFLRGYDGYVTYIAE